MLSGRKQLAFLVEREAWEAAGGNAKALNLAVGQGRIVMERLEPYGVLLATPASAPRLRRLRSILERDRDRRHGLACDVALGLMLGYGTNRVRWFIGWSKQFRKRRR